jgi:hypothetical protein
VLSWTNLFDTLKNMTGVMGEDVALHADSKIRDTIVAGVTGQATSVIPVRHRPSLV